LSVRAQVDYAFVSGGLPLQDTWQLLLPGVLTHFSPLYIGVVGLGLAGLALGDRLVGQGNGTRISSRQLWFFVGLTVVALLLAHGDHGLLYPLFYRWAPGWDLFRGQERAALLVAFGLSVLAGYGTATIPQMALSSRRWLAAALIGLVAAGVYAFGLLWQFLGHSAIGQGRYLFIALVTLLLAGGLVVALRIEGWDRRRQLLLGGLVVGNLFWANLTTNLTDFGPARKTILAPEMAAIKAAVRERGTVNLGLPGRTYNEARVYEDYGIRSQVEDVWGSSPLRLATYARLFDNFPLDRLWRLTGVEHVLTWRRELFEPSTLLAEFPQTTDTTYLHRLNEPNPRAWLVATVQPATDVAALALLADHTFDLDANALINPVDLPEAVAVEAGVATIELRRLATNRLHVQVTSAQGGLLVISENWLPGWRVLAAQCDTTGSCSSTLLPPLQLFHVYRTNLSFLGVPVPAGDVTFDLVYAPISVRNGLWISGGSAGVLVLFVGWRWWQRRRTSV
jgi:hypothetical protein